MVTVIQAVLDLSFGEPAEGSSSNNNNKKKAKITIPAKLLPQLDASIDLGVCTAPDKLLDDAAGAIRGVAEAVGEAITPGSGSDWRLDEASQVVQFEYGEASAVGFFMTMSGGGGSAGWGHHVEIECVGVRGGVVHCYGKYA